MDSEQGHDYAEIYTPSTEKDAWEVAKPPTPPLHRLGFIIVYYLLFVFIHI